MFLALDLGNSRAHFGLFSGRRLVRRAACTYAELELVEQAWSSMGLPTSGVHAALISSVNPPASSRLALFLRRKLGVEAPSLGVDRSFTSLLPAPLPAGVGADRVINALAGHAFAGGAAIVVDCGTAITVDAVDEDGALLGGAIAPGVRMGARALSQNTRLLPEVEPRAVKSPIGKSTVEALRAGLVLGFRGLVSGLVGALRAELGPWPLLATGGDAELLCPDGLEGLVRLPDLTLHGIRLAWERCAR